MKLVFVKRLFGCSFLAPVARNWFPSDMRR